MEKILISVGSDDTSSAIKKFVSQFKDATIQAKESDNNEYYLNTYGINKTEFENQLNIGIAQSILGIKKPWNEIKRQLLSKIVKD